VGDGRYLTRVLEKLVFFARGEGMRFTALADKDGLSAVVQLPRSLFGLGGFCFLTCLLYVGFGLDVEVAGQLEKCFFRRLGLELLPLTLFESERLRDCEDAVA